MPALDAPRPANWERQKTSLDCLKILNSIRLFPN